VCCVRSTDHSFSAWYVLLVLYFFFSFYSFFSISTVCGFNVLCVFYHFCNAVVTFQLICIIWLLFLILASQMTYRVGRNCGMFFC